jgi:ABC-type uncharacterized transport system involved in gliding motility auxiliary subunit
MSPAALLGALGGVALSFGLLSLLLAIFQPLMPAALVYGNLIVGVLLLSAGASWGFDGLRDRLRSGSGRRAGVLGMSAIVGTTLGVVLLGLLAFLSTRYTARFDWSEERVNSLSEQSLSLLADLEDDVQLTAFFREQDSPLTRDLLERYDHASDRLGVRFVDPNQRPDLLEAHGIEPADLARGLILVARGDDAVRVDGPSEVEITNALLKLTRRGGRTVYFLEGHNERRIGSPDADPDSGSDEQSEGRAGFSRFAAALRNDTHNTLPLLLAASSEVPEDANLVVIAGPTRSFFDEEREALERYLARGGALLVMIDPRAQTNLYEDLTRWGIEMGDDVIVDPVMALNRQPTAPVAESYGPAVPGGVEPHPIALKLGRTVFSMARSVSPTDGAVGDIVPLVLTSGSSWGERDLDGWMKSGHATQDEGDLVGPVSIAVVGRPKVESSDPEKTPRIVVFGDSNFATNELVDAFGNRDLALNSVNWLLGDVEHITVRPNVSRSSTVAMTAGQLQAIQYLALFVMPEGIALVGVLAWWFRRRAPAG